MISFTELFKIGIGPSSSHTGGPMTAAADFAASIARDGLLGRVDQVLVTLFGSLAWTGRGHGTDKAVILGLSGLHPAEADPDLLWLKPHVARLRRKVDSAGGPQILAVRGVGYRLEV